MYDNHGDTAPTAHGDPKSEIELIEWEAMERPRVPWVRPDHYGQTIAPLKDQKTNNEITNEEVLQPRDEPVETSSHAFPISGIEPGSTEPTHHKASGNFTNKTGVAL